MKIYDESVRARLMENENIAPTVMSHYGTGGGNVPFVNQDEVVYCLQGNGIDRADTAGCNGLGVRQGASYTLNTIDRHGVTDIPKETEPTNPYEELRKHCRVRRLTPLECERLQGMPDGWTDGIRFTDEEITPELIEYFRQVWLAWDTMNADGKKVKPKTDKAIVEWLKKSSVDGARYKALGNGIATPQWKWVCKRISAQYERDATMGSLFDGIGSFPYIWEQINGKGSCLWSSEIEPFPIKVTFRRFGN